MKKVLYIMGVLCIVLVIFLVISPFIRRMIYSKSPGLQSTCMNFQEGSLPQVNEQTFQEDFGMSPEEAKDLILHPEDYVLYEVNCMTLNPSRFAAYYWFEREVCPDRVWHDLYLFERIVSALSLEPHSWGEDRIWVIVRKDKLEEQPIEDLLSSIRMRVKYQYDGDNKKEYETSLDLRKSGTYEMDD